MSDPLTVDQLIATLQAVRDRYGGDVPVVMCDEEPVVKAGVVHYAPMAERMRAAFAGEEDPPKRPHCIITDRHEDDGGEWAEDDDAPAEGS